jgi:dephospho-CoA kinase
MATIKSFTAQPVIGITGGMGSGKSAVASFLNARLGGTYIDADVVCRELLLPGAAGWRSFKENFGPDYLNPDQSINRILLRQVIFADEEIRLRLNALLHPLAKEEIARRVENATASGWFLVEVPLLYEARWEADLDRVIVVYADFGACLRRLMKRDHLQRKEAGLAIGTQWPLPVKALRADHVIDNSGPWALTCLQVLHLGELLQHYFGQGQPSMKKND